MKGDSWVCGICLGCFIHPTSCSPGRWPRGEPRTCWMDCVPLSGEGTFQEPPRKVPEENDVWATELILLPLQPKPECAEEKWINGTCTKKMFRSKSSSTNPCHFPFLYCLTGIPFHSHTAGVLYLIFFFFKDCQICGLLCRIRSEILSQKRG